MTMAAIVSAMASHTVTHEGAWCWFADPRAIHYENASGSINASYIGYIDVHGNVKATQIDFRNNRRTEVLIRSVFQPDDHNNPTFIVLPDERVMIFYTRHTDEPKIWYRVSVKPGDITQLGEEKFISTKNNTTYPSPFILSDDPNHIYLCWRGINWHPTMARITMPDANDNVTVDFGPKQIVQSTGARPYAKYHSNGKDKIYLTYTTGHPDNEMPNWLYFNVVDINHGNGPILKDIKGNTLQQVADGVFRVNKSEAYLNQYPFTVVDHTPGVRNWVWQIALDQDANPVIAYTHIDNAKTTHAYHYGRWTGSEWRDTWVQLGGHAFHQNWNRTERCYSGGMALDPENINTLYLSIPTKEGAYNKEGVYEIWKYNVADNGKVESSEQLTRNSDKNNMRPYLLPGSKNSALRLAWMHGDYYYWMVNKHYPKGYPTSIVADYNLPEEKVDLGNGLVTQAKGCKKFSVAATFHQEKDEKRTSDATLFASDQLTVGITTDNYIFVNMGKGSKAKSVKSGNLFATADNWAFYSIGTSGDTHVTPITDAMAMDNTYDGSGNNDQITGLTTMKDFTVTTYAPEPVSNLTVNFAGLSGTVAFTLPTQNVKGESLSGNVEYVVYINGEQKAKAGAPAGAQVAETLTLSEAGNQQVSVVAVQSDVTSCASLWKGYVGADKPAAPANVTAQAAAKNDAGQYPITVTWTAPTYGVNGGAIDPAALTYKVTRLPEGVEVYSGSELTYTDLVAAELKTSVKYAVVAINGTETSDPAESNYVQIGEQQGVPFSDDFNDTSADRSDWTIIDANNDGSTWVLNQGNYSYKYNQANPADDYVVLPAIKLEAGNLYHFDIKARNTSPTERIAAYVGKTATVEGLDTEIIAPTEITYDDGEKELRGNFIPTESVGTGSLRSTKSLAN